MYYQLEVEVPMLNLTTLKDEPKRLNAETFAKSEEQAKQDIQEFYAEDLGIPMSQVKIVSIRPIDA